MSKTLTFDIPDIPDEQLQELVDRIRPVVRRDGQLFYIEPPDPRRVSFLWDPVLTGEATDLVEIGVVPTLHTWGYYGFFKPSVAEVIRMIPHHLIGAAVAFEIDGPDDADDLNGTWAVVEGGCHLARTTLYRKDDA